jgi:hypothetical protein
MNLALTVIFFEDYFTCSIQPNESAWETVRPAGEENNLLYFYVSSDAVRNDAFARERFEAGDANAYGEFYQLITDPAKTFQRYAHAQEAIHLLKDILERVKWEYAERIKRFTNDFDEHAPIPLNICFIPGIAENAQKLITEYFISEGFKLNSEAGYFEAWLTIFHLKGIIPAKINLSVVETYFGDLYLNYLEYNETVCRKEARVIESKGVDHRVGSLARMIVEKAARKNTSQLLNDSALIDQEIKRFHRRAAVEINNFAHGILDIKVELSDFSSARVVIDQRELESASQAAFGYIKFVYESFISTHSNLSRTEKIVLNGDVLSSDAFTGFFRKEYGAGKIVQPCHNFAELLSRGVFALAPAQQFLSPAAAPPMPVQQRLPFTESHVQAPPKPGKPPVPQKKDPPPLAVPLPAKKVVPPPVSERKTPPPPLPGKKDDSKPGIIPPPPLKPPPPPGTKPSGEKSPPGKPPLPPLPGK